MDPTKISAFRGTTKKTRKHENIIFSFGGTNPNAVRNRLKPSQNIQQHRLYKYQPSVQKQELESTRFAKIKTFHQEYLKPDWSGSQSRRKKLSFGEQKTTFS